MTEIIQVFKMKFAPSVKKVILLDNAPSYPMDHLRATFGPQWEICALPPNTTSLIQPNDQGTACTNDE